MSLAWLRDIIINQEYLHVCLKRIETVTSVQTGQLFSEGYNHSSCIVKLSIRFIFQEILYLYFRCILPDLI